MIDYLFSKIYIIQIYTRIEKQNSIQLVQIKIVIII